jgi:hypothetical protein
LRKFSNVNEFCTKAVRCREKAKYSMSVQGIEGFTAEQQRQQE